MENRSLLISETRKEVQALLLQTSKDSTIPVFYTIFIPKRADKATTKTGKSIIDKLVFLDTATLVESMIFILNDDALQQLLTQRKIPLQDLAMAIRETLQRFKEMNQVSTSLLEDMESLIIDKKYNEKEKKEEWEISPLWKKLCDNLYSAVQYSKKYQIEDNDLLLLQEIILWLEAIHLHFCINVKRQEISDILSSKKDKEPVEIKMVPHPIEEKNGMIDSRIEFVLMLIAKMDTKESLPIIIAILEDIKQKIKSDRTTDDGSGDINICLKILNDANEIQYKTIRELIAFLGNVGKINTDLQDLVNAFSRIKVTADNHPLCKELALTVEGLYLHTYIKQSSFDAENQALIWASRGKLTKMAIAAYYHLSVIEIENKIEEFEQALKVKKAVTVPPPVLPLPEKPLQEIVFHENNIQIIKKNDGFHLFIPLEQQFLLTEIEQLLKVKLNDKNEQMTEILFWESLRGASGGSGENKINSLLNALKKYDHLTARQKDHLLYLKDTTISCLTAYQSKTTFKRFLGPISSYFFPRTHWEMAEETIKQVNNEEDPKHILSILFALYFVLPGKLSKELIGIIRQLLLDAYTKLSNIYQLPLKTELQRPRDTLTSYQPMFFTPPIVSIQEGRNTEAITHSSTF